jgi:hypothetical protein
MMADKIGVCFIFATSSGRPQDMHKISRLALQIPLF